jgi:hypothetical protein
MTNSDPIKTINLVAKDQLARMLAKENIEIRHSTKSLVSSFDAKKRVLTLPVWNKANEDVYDLLVAREVGRALHSPSPDHINSIANSQQPDNPKNYSSFVSAMEGIRVENMMKKDYPGLGRSFINGYNDLYSMGFFGIDQNNIGSLSLADRIDLYSKIGQYGTIDIPFTREEEKIRDEAMSTNSFDDVVNVTRKIYHHRDQGDEDNNPDPDSNNGDNEEENGEGQGEGNGQGQGDGQDQGNNQGNNSDSDSDSDNNNQGNNSAKNNQQNNANSNSNGNNSNKSQQNNSPQQPQTSQKGGKGAPSINNAPSIESKMNEKIQSLASNNNQAQNNYIYYKTPNFDTMSIVNDYKKIYQTLDSAYSTDANYSGTKVLRNIESRNKDFVTTLVQLFEQKMSADEARRERTARTGRLDMRQIANYKFKDNLFLKNTIIPNGKNHGMVMIVDWSGSMSSTIVSVVEQILSMVFFCRRMKIPYEVYAFADCHNSNPKYANYGDNNFVQPYGQCFHNFLSSRMSNAEFRKNAAHFCQLTVDVGSGGGYLGGKKSQTPAANKISAYGLTGTPLNEAIYNSVDLVNIFRAANKLEIVNVFVLTDGGGCGGICLPQNGRYNVDGNTILIDKKGHQHQLSVIDSKYPYADTANELNGIVEYAKKTTGANYISIFLSGAMNYPQNSGKVNVGQKSSDIKEFWKKNNYISYTEDRGYTESFTIKSHVSIVNNDAFSSLSDDSSDKQIENAFAENMQKKRTSRVFLNRFADLIAKKVLV